MPAPDGPLSFARTSSKNSHQAVAVGRGDIQLAKLQLFHCTLRTAEINRHAIKRYSGIVQLVDALPYLLNGLLVLAAKTRIANI